MYVPLQVSPSMLISNTQPTAAHWKEIQAGIPVLPDAAPDRLASMDEIGGWWVDEAFFVEKEATGDHSGHRLSTWLRSGCFRHPITGTMFGGPYGSKWAVLALIRFHWTFAALAKGVKHPYQKKPKPSHNHFTRLEEDSRWLIEQIVVSVYRVSQLKLESPTPLDIQTPSFSDFHLAEPIQLDESEVRKAAR